MEKKKETWNWRNQKVIVPLILFQALWISQYVLVVCKPNGSFMKEITKGEMDSSVVEATVYTVNVMKKNKTYEIYEYISVYLYRSRAFIDFTWGFVVDTMLWTGQVTPRGNWTLVLRLLDKRVTNNRWPRVLFCGGGNLLTCIITALCE